MVEYNIMQSENYIKIVSFDTGDDVIYGDQFNSLDHLNEYTERIEGMQLGEYYETFVQVNEFPQNLLIGIIDKNGVFQENKDKNPFTCTYGISTSTKGKPVKCVKRTTKLRANNSVDVDLFECVNLTYDMENDHDEIWIVDHSNHNKSTLALEYKDETFPDYVDYDMITDDVILIQQILDNSIDDTEDEEKFRKFLFPDDTDHTQDCTGTETYLYNTKIHKGLRLYTIAHTFEDIEDPRKHSIAIIDFEKGEFNKVVGVDINLETMTLTMSSSGKPFVMKYKEMYE